METPTFYTAYDDSPLGRITLASDGKALTGLWFDGQKHFAEGLSSCHTQRDDLPLFKDVRTWLSSFFCGIEPPFTPPLNPKGSDFQQCVWKQLLSIPFGETMTYGELAQRVARVRGLSSMSAQAVGGAVARNPISLIIPCHRVVGTNGSLTGYAAGIDRKAWLLQMEKTGKALPFRENPDLFSDL